tara:strand:- start:60 stop:728 length:669 start_codon:yes stop_codon:yes gene_type:complete
MFKKLIITAISASLVASSVFADSTNIGFRISSGNLAASGTETTNLASANVTQAEKDANFEMASFFIERQFETSDKFNIILGLDYVPITAEVASLGGTTGFNAKVSAGNLFTAYLQPTIIVNDNISVFGKVGVASGDLEITEISRQATTAGTASTDVAQDKSLEGTVYGIGAQMNRATGPFDFIRLEVTQTDFDKISHTNSNSKKLTADAEMQLITLSIGKSF